MHYIAVRGFYDLYLAVIQVSVDADAYDHHVHDTKSVQRDLHPRSRRHSCRVQQVEDHDYRKKCAVQILEAHQHVGCIGSGHCSLEKIRHDDDGYQDQDGPVIDVYVVVVLLRHVQEHDDAYEQAQAVDNGYHAFSCSISK